MSNPFDLTGKVALVTGGNVGLGQGIALALAEAGADIVSVALSDSDDTVAKVQALGRRAHAISADLTSIEPVGRVVEEALAAMGRIDILVNNAGLGGYGEFSTQPPAEIDRMIAVNIGALTGLTRAFLPDMLARGRGRVLNVASTAAFQPGPMMAVYYATKAYVLSFSEAIAEEVAGSGVSVTAL
ncbi:MAG: SDR family NAD(P)-dependent oxidoreductase, partial [Hyphomonas sp.]